MASHGLDPLGPLTAPLPTAAGKPSATSAEPFVQLLLATDFRPAQPPPRDDNRTPIGTEAESAPPAAPPEARGDDESVEDTDERDADDESSAAPVPVADLRTAQAVAPDATVQPAAAAVDKAVEETGRGDEAVEAVELPPGDAREDAPDMAHALPASEQPAEPGEHAELPAMSAQHRSPGRAEAVTQENADAEHRKSNEKKTRSVEHSNAAPRQQSAKPADDEPTHLHPATTTSAHAQDVTPGTEQGSTKRESDVRRTAKSSRRETVGEPSAARVPSPHVQRPPESQLPPHVTAPPAPTEIAGPVVDSPAAPVPAPEAPTVTSSQSSTTSQRLPDHLLSRKARPAAAASTLTPVQQTRFVQRVAGAIEAARTRDGQVRLRLSPPELGALKLEVKVEDGVLNARIEAETEIAKTALVENFPALRDRLAEQGIRIENFHVDVADHRGEHQQAQDAPQQDQPPRDRDPAASQRRSRASATPTTTSDSGSLTHGQQQLNVII